MLDRICFVMTMAGLIAMSFAISYMLAEIGEPRAVWLWSDILGLL